MLFGSLYLIDEDGRSIGELRHARFDFDYLFDVGIDMHQQGMFWRRDPSLQVGMLDSSLHFAVDFDMFVKLARLRLHFERTSAFLVYFRIHEKATCSLIPAVGKAENQRILESVWRTSIHTQLGFPTRSYLEAKRCAWFLLHGEWQYVIRGMRRR